MSISNDEMLMSVIYFSVDTSTTYRPILFSRSHMRKFPVSFHHSYKYFAHRSHRLTPFPCVPPIPVHRYETRNSRVSHPNMSALDVTYDMQAMSQKEHISFAQNEIVFGGKFSSSFAALRNNRI